MNQFKIDEKERIVFIQGFLNAMEFVNSFVNDGKTFKIKRIDLQKKDLEKSINEEFPKEYNIKFKEIKNPSLRLTETTPVYFNTYIYQIIDQVVKADLKSAHFDSTAPEYVKAKKEVGHRFKLNQLNFSVDKMFCSLINEDDTFYELEIDWDNGPFYECYHNDFVIANKERAILIHLGGSD